MRTTFVAALAVLTAAVALSPVGGQAPPAAPKAQPPAPPAAVPAPPPTTAQPTEIKEIGGKTIEVWIKEIEHPDPSVREQAIRTVLLFGPGAKKALRPLTRQARQIGDFSPQSLAIFALGVIVPDLCPDNDKDLIKDAVEALTRALDSTQAIIRLRAAVALGNIGPPARTAVIKLSSQIRNTMSWEFRKAICYALGQVGRDEQGWPEMRALAALVDAIDDPSSKEVRMEALQAIINLGPPASGNVPEFKNLIERRIKAERDKAVVIWVRVALMRMDEKAINDTNLSTIAKLMKDNDPDIRVQAARALGYIGMLAKSTLPDLMEALKSDEPLMVAQVIWSVARMGHHAEKAIPALETLAQHHKEEVIKASAKQAIEEIKKAVAASKQNPPK